MSDSYKSYYDKVKLATSKIKIKFGVDFVDKNGKQYVAGQVYEFDISNKYIVPGCEDDGEDAMMIWDPDCMDETEQYITRFMSYLLFAMEDNSNELVCIYAYCDDDPGAKDEYEGNEYFGNNLLYSKNLLRKEGSVITDEITDHSGNKKLFDYYMDPSQMIDSSKLKNHIPYCILNVNDVIDDFNQNI